MTRPDQTFRATEGSGPWLHPPRKTERRSAPGSTVMLLIALILWGVIGLVAGIALGASPPFEPGPGFDICQTKGC